MPSFELVLHSKREEDVQSFLAQYPDILISAFANHPGGSGRTLCIPKFRFGTEFICDFLILYGHFGRWEVTLIELEPPTANPFTKAGNFAKRLNEAIRQVHDWLGWIHTNPEYFRTSLSKHSDELADTSHPIDRFTRIMTCAKIIIGRRSMLTPSVNARRHTVYAESGQRLEIIPYDRLVKFYDYDRYKEA